MPESSSRKKPAYTPPPPQAPKNAVSPRWLVPAMLGFFLVGLAWIVTYYITQAQYPIDSLAWVPGVADDARLGNGNLAVGFAFVGIGFMLATRWR